MEVLAGSASIIFGLAAMGGGFFLGGPDLASRSICVIWLSSCMERSGDIWRIVSGCRRSWERRSVSMACRDCGSVGSIGLSGCLMSVYLLS